MVEQSRKEEEEARFWRAYMLILPGRSRLSFFWSNEYHSVLGRSCSSSPNYGSGRGGGFPKRGWKTLMTEKETEQKTVATSTMF